MNYEESRIHREFVDDVDSHVAMTSKKAKPKHKSSSKYNAPPKSSSGQLTCYCCGMKGHMKSECYKREKAECTFCKQKGHLVQACMKKAPGTKPGSLASSLKSDRASSEATEQDLVVDSGSTDHIVVNKNWFKSIREIETTVTNPDGGNIKVLGIGEVEVLAKDVKGRTKPLILKKALYVPGYRTNLISVSSIIDNGHKVVHEKRNSYLCLKSKENFPITRKGKLFFLPTTPKEKYHFANLSGGSNETELWHKRMGHLNYRDLNNSLPMDLKLHDEKCETCCLAKTTKTPVPKQNENKASKAGERVFTDVVGPRSHQALMGFVISSLSLTTTARMHVLSSCDTRIKRCKNSKSTLLKMVVLAYYGLTMAPSIRTKVSNSFVQTTKSSENTLFLKLRNRMVSQSDTTKQLLKLLEVF